MWHLASRSNPRLTLPSAGASDLRLSASARRLQRTRVPASVQRFCYERGVRLTWQQNQARSDEDPAVPIHVTLPILPPTNRLSFYLAVAVLVVSHSQHRQLRQMRLRGASPAAVYPHRDPILGIDWVRLVLRALADDTVLEWWHQLFTQSAATTFWFNGMGSWMLMTCEPENFRAILQGQFNSWPIEGLRKQTIASVIGSRSIFSTNGPEWAHARSMMRPTFVRNQIADLECLDRHVDNFLARLRPGGSKVDLQALFYMFTMDTSTDFMFGRSTEMLVRPSDEAVKFSTSFDYALQTSTSRGRIGWLAHLIPDKKFDASVAYCRAFIDRYVASALREDKPKERSYVFMHELINSGATHQETSDQLLSMILGGRDTSASTLSSLCWILARRPDVVRAIRKEALQLEGKRPTWEQLKDLKYLNNVLKEALRLWGPVTANMRTACTDLVLPKGGGPDCQSPVFVPKGTQCRFSTFSLHRRKDIYGDDAEEFRPERWDSLRTSWEYLPFSGGPRICIGQQFALTMMLYLLTRFFQEFEAVEARDDRPMKLRVSSNIVLPNGCWVALTPA
ncbi:hypothetical protein XA68_14531 [Ophiocordyceps unilateralis]|uniref:Cytochrome P450 n=1 Tax=Ophiocordyceps unilateralis TaxID=268505 RepID=A0A2A9P9D5_OPHUN|nr:hypothetical protein XA68_14531 [Ophiocordyceps unilateralis]